MRNSFEEAVKELTLKYPQYAADAYEFMRAGLDYTVNLRKGAQANKHLTAAELYTGACNYALEEYGPLAHKVLQFWGIHSSRDFGSIVYNLIEVGIFGKQKEDKQEDTWNGRDQRSRSSYRGSRCYGKGCKRCPYRQREDR